MLAPATLFAASTAVALRTPATLHAPASRVRQLPPAMGPAAGDGLAGAVQHWQRTAASVALSALLLCSAPGQQACLPAFLGSSPAQAKELASGSGSKVNKDPLSLLRLGLPNQGKDMRELQGALEDSQDYLTRLLFSKANTEVDNAAKVTKSKAKSLVAGVPAGAAEKASGYLSEISAAIDDLKAQTAARQTESALASNAKALASLSRLEELVATTAVQPPPPNEFKEIPWLKGRATVALTLKRDGASFDVDGKLYNKLDLTMVVDGYTAPVTAGNFVDLVDKGFYNGMHIQRSDGFVVQTGDPSAEGKGSKHGFTPSGSDKERRIPLEVQVKGDKSPIYGSTFDDDGRGGYAASLPFNAYGALGMAREEYEVDSASSQWFWLLFDSDLTPAGKNLLDGRYSCFGYTTEGARLLSDVKEGDIIEKASVVSGLENLQGPRAT